MTVRGVAVRFAGSRVAAMAAAAKRGLFAPWPHGAANDSNNTTADWARERFIADATRGPTVEQNSDR